MDEQHIDEPDHDELFAEEPTTAGVQSGTDSQQGAGLLPVLDACRTRHRRRVGLEEERVIDTSRSIHLTLLTVVSLGLLAASPAVAQETPSLSFYLADELGDVTRHGAADMPVPGWADLVGVELSVDGNDLTIDLEMAGPLPDLDEVPPLFTNYTLEVLYERKRDRSAAVSFGPTPDPATLMPVWGAHLTEINGSDARETPLGELDVDATSLSLTVPLGLLDGLNGSYIRAHSFVADMAVFDGAEGPIWQDVAPDAFAKLVTREDGRIDRTLVGWAPLAFSGTTLDQAIP